MARLRLWTGINFIVVATSLAYFPCWNGGFILDDDGLLTSNLLVQAPDGLYRMWFTTQSQDYWPLTYSTFWCEWRIWGNNPAGYHAVNLTLHIVESLLIWLILTRLSIPGAFLAAVLFALHPVNVDSVAWISQRKNTLAMLFFLVSILSYLKSDGSLIIRAGSSTDNMSRSKSFAVHRNFCWYLLSLLAFLLANVSKGSVVILPLILVALILWRRKITQQDLIYLTPFFVVAVVFTVVNIWFQSLASPGVIRDASFIERLLGAGAVIWFYLWKALWPFDLAFIYPMWHIESDNWTWWLPLLATVGLTILLWLQRKTLWGRSVLLAWAFFCIALLPVLGFTDVGFMRFSLVSDHYLHIAIIAVVAIVAAAWSNWRQNLTLPKLQSLAALPAIAAVTIFGYLTWQQASLFQDAHTIYAAALQKNTDSWMLHGNFGDTLLEEGEVAAAVDQLHQALQLNPDSYDAYCNLGRAEIRLGHLPEATDHLKHAIELKPNMIEAYRELAMLYAQTDHPDEALSTAEKALEIARSKGLDLLADEIEHWIEVGKQRLSKPKAINIQD